MGGEERARYSRNAIEGFVFAVALVAWSMWKNLPDGMAWFQCAESETLIDLLGRICAPLGYEGSPVRVPRLGPVGPSAQEPRFPAHLLPVTFLGSTSF